MKGRSYKLAHYEIVLDSREKMCWKSHGGFSEVRTGRCFIEGDVLFLGPTEETELGFLKNEWLKYLEQFPTWDKTNYYCPSYTLLACEGDTVRRQTERPGTIELPRGRTAGQVSDHSLVSSGLFPLRERSIQRGHHRLTSASELEEEIEESEGLPPESFRTKSTSGIALPSLYALAGIEQLKVKLEKALGRCKGLIKFKPERGKSNELNPP